MHFNTNTISMFHSSQGIKYSIEVNQTDRGEISISVKGQSPKDLVKILAHIRHFKESTFQDSIYTTQNAREMRTIIDDAVHKRIIDVDQADTIKALFSKVHKQPQRASGNALRQVEKDPELEAAMEMSLESLQKETKRCQQEQIKEDLRLAQALSESLNQPQEAKVEKLDQLGQQDLDLAMSLSLAEDEARRVAPPSLKSQVKEEVRAHLVPYLSGRITENNEDVNRKALMTILLEKYGNKENEDELRRVTLKAFVEQAVWGYIGTIPSYYGGKNFYNVNLDPLIKGLEDALKKDFPDLDYSTSRVADLVIKAFKKLKHEYYAARDEAKASTDTKLQEDKLRIASSPYPQQFNDPFRAAKERP